MKHGPLACVALCIALATAAAWGQGGAEPTGAAADGWPDVSSLDPVRYREAVSTAHQGVKLVYAPLTAEQEAAIDKAWAPAYSYPCPGLVSYLNALLPPVEEFLATRGQASIVAPQFDAAYREALAYQAIQDAVSAEEALSVAWVKKQQLGHLLGRMAAAGERIRELGDPPDPTRCRARRRQQHEESIRALEKPSGPAWVLTGHKVEWIAKPHVGRFLVESGNDAWADTWSWKPVEDGTSVTSDLRCLWRHTYTISVDAGMDRDPDGVVRFKTVRKPVTRNGFMQSRIRLVWAQVPPGVTYVPDPRVSKSTFLHIPFFIEDLDQRDGKPFLGNDDPKKETPHGGRIIEHGFSAVLYAPDGKPCGAYGGYENFAVKRRVYLAQTPRFEAAAQIQFRFDPGWWRVVYERAHGKGDPAWDNRKPGEGWKIVAALTVKQRMNNEAPMPGRKPGSEDAVENAAQLKLTWEFTFDPVGGTVVPLDLSAQADRYGTPARPPAPQDAARAAEDAKARQEMAAFHEANIRICEANIAKWRNELAAAKNLATRERLLHTLLHAQHTRFAEMDRIRELQTGEIVHTRTPIDEWYAARFVQQVRDRMDPDSQIRRYAPGVQRLTRLAPRDEREKLAAFVGHHMKDAHTWGDVRKMRKIAHVVFEKVQGHWENVSATETEKALDAEQNLRYAQLVKTVAEAEMFVATMGASGWVMPVFEGCVGFAGAEGGLGNRLYEGTKHALMWTNVAGMAAAQAMEGYEKGGWLSGQKGWVGALERGATTFVALKGLEYGVGKLFAAEHPPAGSKPDVKKAFEEARYRIALEDSKHLVDDYHRAYKEYQRAMEFGASGAEIQAMERALRDKATMLHSTYEGKLILKSAARDPKYAELIADYNQRLGQVHEQVQARFRQLMNERGYDEASQWVMREFRNASSAGTVGMDYDIGLMRRYLDSATEKSRLLTEIPFTKDGLRVSQVQLQAEAQAAWEAAYQAVTGRSARRSFETLTTSAHPEIYTDLAWLGTEKIRHVNIGQLASRKAGQAGDVTAYKVAEMMHNPDLLHVSRMVESARGMAKDINTKLLPLIEEAAKRSPQAGARFARYHRHWKQIAAALERAPAQPGVANEQVRLLTGGKDIPEVVLDLRDMIASYGKGLGR